ncbi:unnamed protein product [Cuscuta epithymum]|uniref:DUF6821 domain-containing protein n=1 Tax=Cuscuta epithymum TaxID=186058 RepID=A0AAV0FSZ0_9ASTE|nr:unnamed protein product [Cuscuta epithymum]
MDLDEWEVLSDDGFLQIHEEDEYAADEFACGSLHGVANSVLEMNYFICPPPDNSSNQFVETTNRFIPRDHNRAMPDPTAERVLSQHVSLKELVELRGDMDSPTRKAGDDGDSCFSAPPGLTVDGDVSGGGGLINKWNWGFGAIFSFGVAAAAVCITLVGSGRPNQKLRFQIYSDDKMVGQARKMNGDISGFAITRAQITFGGHYDDAYHHHHS